MKLCWPRRGKPEQAIYTYIHGSWQAHEFRFVQVYTPYMAAKHIYVYTWKEKQLNKEVCKSRFLANLVDPASQTGFPSTLFSGRVESPGCTRRDSRSTYIYISRHRPSPVHPPSLAGQRSHAVAFIISDQASPAASLGPSYEAAHPLNGLSSSDASSPIYRRRSLLLKPDLAALCFNMTSLFLF
jgi:hypothetical protein